MISSHASFSKNYAHSLAIGKQDRQQISRGDGQAASRAFL